MSNIDLRSITEADLDDVLALIHRAQAHDRIPEILSMEELKDDLTGAEAEMATDSRLALIDGDLAGYVHTIYLPSDVRLERCYVVGTVDPDHRGRQVGRTLLGWGVERARTQLLSSGSDLPKFIRASDFDFVKGSHRLFARLGFTPVRYFDQLLRPLSDLPPIEKAEIDGITIIPWPRQRDEELREVKNTAFADHWGSTPSTSERWNHMIEASTTRLDLSWAAVDESDRIVSYCLNERYPADDVVTGRRDGWIGNIGTLKEYRGRGIASALIVRSLHAFVAEGLTHSMLGVDSDNPTGAPQMYRNLGYQPHTRTVTHEIQA